MEGLDVPALVHRLRRTVQLGVQPRHRLGDLAGREQGTLLAVQELREHPGQHQVALAGLLAGRELLITGIPRERHERVRHDGPFRVLGIHGDRPVEVLGRVPLRGLARLVEPGELGLGALVTPIEHGAVAERHAGERLALAALLDQSPERRTQHGLQDAQVPASHRPAEQRTALRQIVEEVHAPEGTQNAL